MALHKGPVSNLISSVFQLFTGFISISCIWIFLFYFYINNISNDYMLYKMSLKVTYRESSCVLSLQFNSKGHFSVFKLTGWIFELC